MDTLMGVIVVLIKALISVGDFVLKITAFTTAIPKTLTANLIKKEAPLRNKKYKYTTVKKKSSFSRLFKRIIRQERRYARKAEAAFLAYERKSVRKVKKGGKKITGITSAIDHALYTFNRPFVRGYRFFVKRTLLSYLKLRRSRLRRIRKFKNLKLPLLIKFRYFFIGSFFSFLFLFLPILVFIFLLNLPNPNELTLKEVAQTTKIYDRNGTLLYQIYANQNRTMIPLSAVPNNLKNATIAIEDKDFYKNPGFDIQAIIRAAIADIKGEPLQGGSTITQQLIKSTLLTPERTITRKIKEIVLAFWAERVYSKNEILQMYFNQVPYGGTAYGVQAAAETYFDKDVNELDLAESAFLAGLTRAPSVYSPFGQTPEVGKKRQKEVLARMEEQRFITKKQRLAAEKKDLDFRTPQTPILAPHFVMYVKDYLIEKYGLPTVEKGGLIVKTTLDLNTQKMAQDIVKDEVNKASKLRVSNGAALVSNPDNGDILAMVGSKNFNDPKDGNVNLTTSLRQPGSSVKVITYAEALNKGYTAASILDDSPVNFGGYSPVNYDGRFHGRVPLRMALGNSYNVPAVRTLNNIGIENMVNLAKKMGISTWNDSENYGLSITLGAAEAKMTDMAEVFGTLANEGKRIDLDPILEINDYKGNIVYKKENPQGEQVLNPAVAFIMTDILADNNARLVEFGPNSGLAIKGYRVSAKTGTSDNKRDNWTFGYTPTRLVSVWVGNNDNTPMDQNLASGITGAAPIWNRIMNNLLKKDSGPKTIAIPGNVSSRSCGGRIEYFIKGTENLATCFPVSTSSSTLSTR